MNLVITVIAITILSFGANAFASDEYRCLITSSNGAVDLTIDGKCKFRKHQGFVSCDASQLNFSVDKAFTYYQVFARRRPGMANIEIQIAGAFPAEESYDGRNDWYGTDSLTISVSAATTLTVECR